MSFSCPPVRPRGLRQRAYRISIGLDSGAPRGEPSQLGRAPTAFSPNGSAWLVFFPFVDADGSLIGLHGAAALDASGQWWMSNFGKLIAVKPEGKDSSLAGIIEDAFVKYAAPILAGIVAAAVPGVGTFIAGAILVWRGLAMGQTLTDAVINASRAKFSDKSPISLSAWDRGLAAVRSGLSDAAIGAVSKTLAAVNTDPNVKDAFYQAVHLIRGQQVQNLVIYALRPTMNADEAIIAQWARDAGASESSIQYGLFGDQGSARLAKASENASAFVAANVANPHLIESTIAEARATEGKTTALAAIRTGTGVAPSGITSAPGRAKGSSSSGFGLGTVVLLGGGGYLGYRYGIPWLRSHFGKPANVAAPPLPPTTVIEKEKK